jgi:hypothetical protein
MHASLDESKVTTSEQQPALHAVKEQINRAWEESMCNSVCMFCIRAATINANTEYNAALHCITVQWPNKAEKALPMDRIDTIPPIRHCWARAA